jgi:hypothetical protein
MTDILTDINTNKMRNEFIIYGSDIYRADEPLDGVVDGIAILVDAEVHTTTTTEEGHGIHFFIDTEITVNSAHLVVINDYGDIVKQTKLDERATALVCNFITENESICPW